jgi:hypothetical protein
LAVPPEFQTEIKIVEKEKIVYRNQVQYLEKNEQYESQIENLKNEIVHYKALVSNSTYDLQMARDSLNLALIEMMELKNESKVQLEKGNSNFNLKTEKAEEQMQPAKPEPSPKMKFHIIKIPDNNLKYDTNSTLLKK